MESLEKQLGDISADIKAFGAKFQEEVKNLGAAQTETKSALDTLKTQMHTMQDQLDAVDARVQGKGGAGGQQPEFKTLGAWLTESEAYKEAKDNQFMGKRPLVVHIKGGAFPILLEQKAPANISESAIGGATSGVIVQQRLPGVVGSPMQELRIRDVMPVRQQREGNSFDFIRQSNRTNVASPTAEASAKPKSGYNWVTVSGNIATIAHYVDVTRQALDDIPWLRREIDSELTYGLKLKEEEQILAGDGLNANLNGIIPQATAFATGTYLVAAAGWTRLDILRYAKLQSRLVGLASYPPSAFVLHPTDLAQVELTKDNEKRYIVGDPKTGAQISFIWGLPVVESDSITAGDFLVGPFANGATLIDRMAVSIEISYEHSTNFTSNMATILCEERIGLAVKVPTAFTKGTFTTSP